MSDADIDLPPRVANLIDDVSFKYDMDPVVLVATLVRAYEIVPSLITKDGGRLSIIDCLHAFSTYSDDTLQTACRNQGLEPGSRDDMIFRLATKQFTDHKNE